MKLVSRPKDTGEAVEAVIEITDADNDGILGKATLGRATIDILGAGRRILRFPKGTPTGATLARHRHRRLRHDAVVVSARQRRGVATLVRSTFRAWVQ